LKKTALLTPRLKLFIFLERTGLPMYNENELNKKEQDALNLQALLRLSEMDLQAGRVKSGVQVFRDLKKGLSTSTNW
jgi:hypothetical protein